MTRRRRLLTTAGLAGLVLASTFLGKYYNQQTNSSKKVEASEATSVLVASSSTQATKQESPQIPEYDEINEWFVAPPVGYNPEVPFKSGNFKLYEQFPLPTQFVKPAIDTETLQGAVFSLDDLLETKNPETQKYVTVYPSNWDRKADFAYIYGTATGWFCSGCEYLKKQGLEEKLKAEIDKLYKGKFTFIKISHPGKKPLPALFDKEREFYSEGVPVLLVGKIDDGKVRILAEVPEEDFVTATEDSKTLMQRAVEGKPVSTVILSREDFRNFKVTYSLERESQKHLYDHFAILLGHALFPDNFIFDRQKNQFIFTANLAEPEPFEFARAYNDRYGKASLGRNVFRKIRQEANDYFVKIADNNPVLLQVAEWAYNERDILWQLDPNSENYWRKYRVIQGHLAGLTKGCVPYVGDFYEDFIRQRIEAFMGKPGIAVHLIPELNSPLTQRIARKLAEKNHWKLKEHSLPTQDEIRGWQTKYALPTETVQALQETRSELERALQTMETLGIQYLQPTLPYQVLDTLLISSQRTFVLSAPPEYSDFIQDVNNFSSESIPKDDNRELRNYNSLRALLCLAEKPEYRNIRKIFIPYYETDLGREAHPETDLQGYVAPIMGGLRQGMVLLNGRRLEIRFPSGSIEPSAQKMIEITDLNAVLKEK